MPKKFSTQNAITFIALVDQYKTPDGWISSSMFKKENGFSGNQNRLIKASVDAGILKKRIGHIGFEYADDYDPDDTAFIDRMVNCYRDATDIDNEKRKAKKKAPPDQPAGDVSHGTIAKKLLNFFDEPVRRQLELPALHHNQFVYDALLRIEEKQQNIDRKVDAICNELSINVENTK